VWHVEFDPPKVEDVCDKCGGELYHRDDDYPETVRHRLDVYVSQTRPLIEFYDRRRQLVGMDAHGPVEDVTERAIESLATLAG
jgi:adenylate kinase